MELNPYESPRTDNDPSPPTVRPLWLDTIYLLLTAVLVCWLGPYVIAVLVMVQSGLAQLFR